MDPKVVIIPAVLFVGGVAAFLLVPLELPLRVAILISDILAAFVVGVALWRRRRS